MADCLLPMISGEHVWNIVSQMAYFEETARRRLVMESEEAMKKLESLNLNVVVIDGHFTMRCAYLLPQQI